MLIIFVPSVKKNLTFKRKMDRIEIRLDKDKEIELRIKGRLMIG